MIENILTALGVALTPTVAGIRAFFSLDNRISVLETRNEDKKELQQVKDQAVMDKLDAISEKIDLRCDGLEARVQRIERSMNGFLTH